jgi:hypothetical protein
VGAALGSTALGPTRFALRLHARRDFANGFMVAEMFNRYFKQDIQMHSFDNGTSMARRKDNWEQVRWRPPVLVTGVRTCRRSAARVCALPVQLEKFFVRNNFPISREDIDSCIHCKPGAGVEMACKVYTILTGKTCVCCARS